MSAAEAVVHDATARAITRRSFRPSCPGCGWVGTDAPRYVAERAAARHNREAREAAEAAAEDREESSR